MDKADLVYLRDAIEESRSILTLEENWDGEGSPGYSEETWKRAVDFLWDNALFLWREYGVKCGAPAIYGGPRGTIDLYWKTETRSLLINVPGKSGKEGDGGDERITFYGCDKQRNIEVKGYLGKYVAEGG